MISYKRIFHLFIWVLFISFLLLYFAQSFGYYEDLNNKKSYLTEEKIKQFESDVKKGKKIKVENYVVDIKKDYSNKISSFGLFTSKTMASTFKWIMSSIFDSIDKIPTYPKHANCRCTCIPLPEDIDESEIKETYSEWFERQSDKTKHKVLGKTRFQLYEQGMKIKQFVNNGKITPLKDLKPNQTE